MSFPATVRGILEANAPFVAALPMTKFWFSEIPQGVSAPFICATTISTDPQNTMDEGVDGVRAQLDNTQLQLSIYGTTLAHAIEIARLARRALTNEPLLHALCTGDDESFEEDVKLRGRILTFSCWYAEDLAPA